MKSKNLLICLTALLLLLPLTAAHATVEVTNFAGDFVFLLASSGAFGSAKEIESDGRFVAYDNGTVKDTKTGLMWASKDNGKGINWKGAKLYCEHYRGGGYTDSGCRLFMNLQDCMTKVRAIKLNWGATTLT